jgi:hypothetical protein
MNFFSLSSSTLNGRWSKQGTNFEIKTGNGSCKSTQERYTYKIIPSIIKNTSTEREQLNGISTTKYGENAPLRNYYNSIIKKIENLSGTMENLSEGNSEIQS